MFPIVGFASRSDNMSSSKPWHQASADNRNAWRKISWNKFNQISFQNQADTQPELLSSWECLRYAEPQSLSRKGLKSMSSTQTRIALLEREQVPAEIQAIYDKLLAERELVPNMFKAVANIPALAMGFAAFLKPLMSDGALPAVYKELVATRVAALLHCDYCISSHLYLAARNGATPEQIESINDYETGPFSEKEKMGLRAADRIHESPYALDDLFYSKLKKHFSDTEIIELVAVASAFEFFPRFVSALRIPVTPLPGEK